MQLIFLEKKKPDSHRKVCENKDFGNIVMPSEDTKTLELNQYEIYDKAPFIIYADLGGLIENIDRCKNNPQNLSITKVDKHIQSGFSMLKLSSF